MSARTDLGAHQILLWIVFRRARDRARAGPAPELRELQARLLRR